MLFLKGVIQLKMCPTSWCKIPFGVVGCRCLIHDMTCITFLIWKLPIQDFAAPLPSFFFLSSSLWFHIQDFVGISCRCHENPAGDGRAAEKARHSRTDHAGSPEEEAVGNVDVCAVLRKSHQILIVSSVSFWSHSCPPPNNRFHSHGKTFGFTSVLFPHPPRFLVEVYNS